MYNLSWIIGTAIDEQEAAFTTIVGSFKGRITEARTEPTAHRVQFVVIRRGFKPVVINLQRLIFSKRDKRL